MSKRIANKTAVAAAFIVLLLRPTTCLAYNAEDLYADCGIEYSSPYAEEDLETIQNYNYAKRYASMFRYVANSNYDKDVIAKRIEEAEKRLEELEKELLSGYDKSTDDIYQLESDYSSTLKELEDARNTELPVEIDFKRITADDVPSYQEYITALNRKKVIDLECELGEEKVSRPSLNEVVIKDFTDDSITYATIPGSGVTALYNGVVSAAGDTHVTVNHHNGIVSSYKGVYPTVKVGDTILQGSPIGITEGEFSVKMRVGEDLIDIHKLLEESDENLQN